MEPSGAELALEGSSVVIRREASLHAVHIRSLKIEDLPTFYKLGRLTREREKIFEVSVKPIFKNGWYLNLIHLRRLDLLLLVKIFLMGKTMKVC